MVDMLSMWDNEAFILIWWLGILAFTSLMIYALDIRLPIYSASFKLD